MTLAEAQALFWDLATGGLARHPDRARALLVELPPLDAVERMQIYANMFVWRQINALRADFPMLVKAMGDRAFYLMTEAYLGQHPSTHHSVSKLGRRLPEYLRRTETPRPDLADLAALELARSQVLEERDAEAVSPALLTQLDPETLAASSIETVPALRLLEMEWDALALWRELEQQRPAPDPRAAPGLVAVWRRPGGAFHVAVAPREAEALRRAASGAPLAEAVEAFGEDSQAALEAVGSWFVEGWVQALIEPSDDEPE